MHEMSLAQNLISQLSNIAAQHDLERVVRVRVEIGPLSGVVVDSFEFGFNILAAEHAFTKDAVLEIVSPSPSYVCLNCGHLYDKDEKKPTICGRCQTSFFVPKGGDDLTLLQVEME